MKNNPCTHLTKNNQCAHFTKNNPCTHLMKHTYTSSSNTDDIGAWTLKKLTSNRDVTDAPYKKPHPSENEEEERETERDKSRTW